jgi:hypothetical protein
MNTIVSDSIPTGGKTIAFRDLLSLSIFLFGIAAFTINGLLQYLLAFVAAILFGIWFVKDVRVRFASTLAMIIILQVYCYCRFFWRSLFGNHKKEGHPTSTLYDKSIVDVLLFLFARMECSYRGNRNLSRFVRYFNVGKRIFIMDTSISTACLLF